MNLLYSFGSVEPEPRSPSNTMKSDDIEDLLYLRRARAEKRCDLCHAAREFLPNGAVIAMAKRGRGVEVVERVTNEQYTCNFVLVKRKPSFHGSFARRFCG